MPTWRCPHCGTPQAETARCWVCHRSSTSCATCRHFRHSVVANVGYCGLDRRRSPLVGDEMRACWDAWPSALDPRPLPVKDGAVAVLAAERLAGTDGPEFSLFADLD